MEDLISRILELSEVRKALSILFSIISSNLNFTVLLEIGVVLGIMGILMLILILSFRRARGYRMPPPPHIEASVEHAITLGEDERSILEYLAERGEAGIDDITAELQMSSSVVRDSVRKLEEKGFVKRTSRSIIVGEEGLRYLAWLQERTWERRRERESIRRE